MERKRKKKGKDKIKIGIMHTRMYLNAINKQPKTSLEHLQIYAKFKIGLELVCKSNNEMCSVIIEWIFGSNKYLSTDHDFQRPNNID